MDREAAARAIADAAKHTRKPVSRALRLAAAVVAALCLGALALGVWTSDSTAPTAHTGPSAPTKTLPSPAPAVVESRGGFGAGLAIGAAAGIAIGIAIARRRR